MDQIEAVTNDICQLTMSGTNKLKNIVVFFSWAHLFIYLMPAAIVTARKNG